MGRAEDDRRYYLNHREELLAKARSRRWDRSDEGRRYIRSENLRRNYGITIEQFEERLLAQDGVCAICGGLPCGGVRDKHLHVDHDHVTGHVRGLLCGNCNRALGLFNDDLERLEQAQWYLRQGGV